MEKIYVTEDELTVLRLYRDCEQASFTKYNQDKAEAQEFVSTLNKPNYVRFDSDVEWYDSQHGKTMAVAFVKRGGSKNE